MACTMNDQKDLPSEILADIILRLPVKSIVQCLSICKQWYSIIKHSSFIKTHLIQLDSSANKYLLFVYDDKISIRCDDDSFNLVYNLKFPHAEKSNIRMHGYCNGLICFSGLGHSYIWNPSIRKIITLPDSIQNHNDANFLLGFGFHKEMNNDYKVVKIPFYYASCMEGVEVYSLSTNSWKSAGKKHKYPTYALGSDQIVVVKDSMYYWLTINNDVEVTIICFDIVNETFREIALPFHRGGSWKKYRLGVSSYGSLIFACVEGLWMYVYCDDNNINNNNNNKWYYDDDDNNNNKNMWVRKTRLRNDYDDLEDSDDDDESYHLIGFMKNGKEVLIEGHWGFYQSYNLESSLVKYVIEQRDQRLQLVQPFVETLVLFDEGVNDRNYFFRKPIVGKRKHIQM